MVIQEKRRAFQKDLILFSVGFIDILFTCLLTCFGQCCSLSVAWVPRWTEQPCAPQLRDRGVPAGLPSPGTTAPQHCSHHGSSIPPRAASAPNKSAVPYWDFQLLNTVFCALLQMPQRVHSASELLWEAFRWSILYAENVRGLVLLWDVKSNLAQTRAPCSGAQEGAGKYPPPGGLPQAGTEDPEPDN